jgi:AbrB family looped-hinge helix DNA binding protein
MAVSEPGRIGKRGTFVIPARLRRRFGLNEGSTVIAEETEDGILLRPAVTGIVARGAAPGPAAGVGSGA